ncbi:MAG TPA: class I SAM-dependent methyltransferase [Rhodoblastus sp.]|nr:class I SAM-dependent methyltransferase [Rhodoblastus sp.]
MLEAEFDKFAEEYHAAHTRNLAITGEAPEHFARFKAQELRHALAARRAPEPRAILDFGSGIGASLPHLKAEFPDARLTAFDVSKKSLDIARARFPDCAAFVHGGDLTALGEARFDVVFAACVFHHIPRALHLGLFRDLRARLNAGGIMIVFEHNPLNPVTRHIVATCPFDENAELIGAGALAATQRAAGLTDVEKRYTGFFPHALRFLRPLEPHLAALPLGAQYYTLAHG